MMTTKGRGVSWSRSYKWYLFLAPVLLGILLFMVYPVVESFRLSFMKSNGFTESWRGLRNYEIVLTNSLFWKSVWNTFYITFFNILLVIPIAFILASVINSMHYGKNLVKGTFFVSYITPTIAATTVFLFVFHPQGIANQLIGLLGLGPVSWLTRPVTAQWSVILYAVWKNLGFNMIIFIANLQTVPSELYEAAAIDGSNSVQSWRYITIPQMGSAIVLLTIMGWIGGLQRFSDVYIFGNGTAGSPERALYTMVTFIYDRGFGSFEFGVAAAAAYILFVIIILFTLISRKVGRAGAARL